MYTIPTCDMSAPSASFHIHEAAAASASAAGRRTGGEEGRESLHSTEHGAQYIAHSSLAVHSAPYPSPASMTSFAHVPSFAHPTPQEQQTHAKVQPKYQLATAIEAKYDTYRAYELRPSTQFSHEQVSHAHQSFPYHQVAQQQRYHDMVQLLGLGPSSTSQSTSPVAAAHGSTFNKDFMNAGCVRDGMGEDEDEDDGDDEEDDLADDVDKGSVNPGCGTRWPRQETLALLKTRLEMDTVFRDSVSKAPLWEEVSRKLAFMGYHRSAKKCKEKFENVYKYYKRTRSSGKQEGKRYRFSLQLEALYLSNKNSGSCSASINDLAETSISNQNNCDGMFMSPKVMNAGIGMIDEVDCSYTSISDDDTNAVCEGTRKRKASASRKECLHFFKNLVGKVLAMQSKMQQRLLETIERQDQERLAREEVWRSQMLAKIKKEEELRAQERIISASRINALVEFLQRVSGQTVKLSTSINPSDCERNDNQYIHDAVLFDDPLKQWSKAEMLALVKLRVGLNNKFAKDDSSLWEEVSLSMRLQGYDSRTALMCKGKWETIIEYFKQTKQGKRTALENDIICPVISMLSILEEEEEEKNHTYFSSKDHNEHTNERIKDFNEHINQMSIPQQSNSVLDKGYDIVITRPSNNYVKDNSVSFSTDGREIAGTVMSSLHKIVRSNDDNRAFCINEQHQPIRL